MADDRTGDDNQSKTIRAYYWRDLPNAAKNVLEWVEDLHSGIKNTITLEVGKRPAYSHSRVTPKEDGKPIVVDQELFDTIKFYVENSKEDRNDYPYLMNGLGEGKMAVWNDMPASSLKVSR